MECLKAQQLLSEAIDGEVAEADLAEARAHCSECEECSRLMAAVERIAALPVPAAAPMLVDTLIALGAQEAVDVRASLADRIDTAPVADEYLPAKSTTRFLPSWWEPRLTALAAVAAVVVVGLVATGIGIGGMLTPKQATVSMSEDTNVEIDGGGAMTAAPPTDGATGSTKAYADASIAPPYVVIDGLVYSPTGQRQVEVSSLVTATPVLTALDTASDPVSLPAFRIGNTPGNAVLLMPDDTYLGFSAVTRAFGGRTFALASGSLLTAYGQWPVLPAQFQAPTAPDGSPTFSFFGKDDAGVLIYVPAGGQPTAGFAVAPGTGPSDPAAGNPNWTWWQPL